MKTFGFDYSFALSIAAVNTILQKNLSSVTLSIQYTTVDEDSGSTIKLDATLAPWQIVRGGQNALLNVNIPISEGNLSAAGGAITGSYDLSGVAVEMQISLGWMGAGDQQQASGNGGVTKLTFNPSNTNQPDDPGYVAAVKVFDPDKKLDTLASGLIKAYFATGLVANKQNLQYIFANVDPTPANVQSWLRPTKWLYYYVETDTLNALAFLCMLTDAPFPQAAFDSSTLESDTNSIVIISQPAFFRNVVLPGVQSAFSGSFSASCHNDSCTIENDGDFTVDKVAVSSFSLQERGSASSLGTDSNGGGPLKFLFGLAKLPHASYSWRVVTANPLVFADEKITFASDSTPWTSQQHTMHWYDWALVAVLGITNAAGLVSMIYDLLKHFSNQVDIAGMKAINDNLQKSTGDTVVNLATLVSWNNAGQTFQPTVAGLEGALYVRGNLA